MERARDLTGVTPMHSLVVSTPEGPISYPWELYLSAVRHQVEIALYHLQQIWALEDGPVAATVWSSPLDERSIWANLQGAMTAAIILSRLLNPTDVRARPGAPRALARKQALERGRRLRDLLAIEDHSPLLAIGQVRNSLDHVDERLDGLVSLKDISSVSDWYIARGLSFAGSVQDHRAVLSDQVLGHVSMRYFDPYSGHLVVDGDDVDLFNYEVALYNVRDQLTVAEETVRAERPPGRSVFGPAQVLRTLNDQVIAARRAEIQRIRREVSRSRGGQT